MVTQRPLRTFVGAIIVIIFLLHVADVLPIRVLSIMENLSYDARLKISMPKTIDKRIVILDIDEKSLAEIGRWPWGRDKLADIVDRLFADYNVKLLAFDMVFAEKDTSSGLQILQRLAETELSSNPAFMDELAKLAPRLENDQLFANTLTDRNIILGYYFKQVGTAESHLTSGRLPEPFYKLNPALRSKTSLLTARGYGANLAEFQNKTQNSGFLDNPLADEDGILRRVPLLQYHAGGIYESFALAIARAALNAPETELIIADNDSNYLEIEGIRLADKIIPVGEHASALIPYRGYQFSFPYVSAVDVLKGRAKKEILENAIVLFGTTSPTLLDLRTTPVQKAYAGVEVHANLVSGILDNRIMQSPAYLQGYEFILLLFIGVLMLTLLRISSPLWSILLSATLLIAVTGSTVYAWHYKQLVLPAAIPAMLILSLFLTHTVFGFFTESRNKQKLAKLFGQYIPPELVAEMNSSPGEFTLQAESREMSVLFMDIRGFTKISEQLEPKQLSQLMNQFLTPMTRVIHQHRGTIDKYMGDSIMAFWGAPLANKAHARHAIQAAFDMHTTLASIQREFAAKKWPVLEIGIGINSGIMSVGNMGSEFRTTYTVMGDAVNLGKRLEDLTKDYGVPIIVGEATRDAVKDYAFIELDRVRVKGKDTPVSIYSPLGAKRDLDQSTLTQLGHYHDALQLYRAQRWTKAEAIFRALLDNDPGKLLYKIYLQRIASKDSAMIENDVNADLDDKDNRSTQVMGK